MGFMLAKDYFWTEATQAFSEEIEHSKQIGLSPEEKTFLTYLSDFYLDSADQLHKYTHPNSEEWTTCYADGSFHVLSLEKFIKENYRFFFKGANGRNVYRLQATSCSTN